MPEESVALSSYSVGDMVRIDYEYGGKKQYLSALISSVGKERYYSMSGCVSINFDTSAYNDTYYFYTEKRKMDRFRGV